MRRLSKMVTNFLQKDDWWRYFRHPTTAENLTTPVQWWAWTIPWCVHFRLGSPSQLGLLILMCACVVHHATVVLFLACNSHAFILSHDCFDVDFATNGEKCSASWWSTARPPVIFQSIRFTVCWHMFAWHIKWKITRLGTGCANSHVPYQSVYT